MPNMRHANIFPEMFSNVIIVHIPVEFYIFPYIIFLYTWEELGYIGRHTIVIKSRDLGRATPVKRWTKAAIDCYQRGCICSGCYYREFFSSSPQKCQMKSTVLELVRVLGIPQNVEQKDSIIS